MDARTIPNFRVRAKREVGTAGEFSDAQGEPPFGGYSRLFVWLRYGFVIRVHHALVGMGDGGTSPAKAWDFSGGDVQADYEYNPGCGWQGRW